MSAALLLPGEATPTPKHVLYLEPGLEVVRILKRKRAALPVALVSGFLTAELREQALAVGVAAVIHKASAAGEFSREVGRMVQAQCAALASAQGSDVPLEN